MTEIFFFQVFEDALTFSIDVNEGALLNSMTDFISFNLSKSVNTFEITWFSVSDNVYATSNVSSQSESLYYAYLPNTDGLFLLSYSILTRDNYWHNGSISLRRDTTSPSVFLHLRTVNPVNTSSIRDIIESESKLIVDTTDYDIFKLSFQDLTSVRYNISLLYSNGTLIQTSVIGNDDFYFTSPGKAENVTISIEIIDEAGNIHSVEWTLSVFNEADFVIPFSSPPILILSFISLIILRRRFSS